MEKPPPCSPRGIANSCASALYEWRVNGRGPLGGDHWRGWRLAGRVLVSPDGDRISPERLRGLLWRERAERPAQGRSKKRFSERPVGDAGADEGRVRHLFPRPR